MRLAIAIVPTDDGWDVTYTASDPTKNFAARQLAYRGKAAARFPIPDSGESAGWNTKTHAPFCTATDTTNLENALNSILLGDADAETRRAFGNYVTAVMLGPHLTTLTGLPAGEPVEIYLSFHERDAATPRLPWELMYGGDEPLAASSARTFAVARVVPRKDAPATTPLALPLNVLFVVGQALDDSIRPGAEYMALVRRLAGAELDARVANMNTRLLLRATKEDIEKAMDEFSPSVVHFICHGDFDGDDATLLITSSDRKQPNAPHPLAAPQLLDLLHGASKTAQLPSAIVLNACHTAEAAQSADRKDAYRSFGATLVAGGVPVVLGMAGEVADGACRIFTCELYHALLKGESVVLASGRGRRAALRGYSGYQQTSEWARPTLFVGSEQTATLPLDRSKESLAIAAGKFVNLDDPRALCGRLASIEAFEGLLRRIVSGSGKRFVLGFGVSAPTEMQKDGHTPQYGKSRVLEEIAVRLALAGIAPVLLSDERNTDTPKNPLQLTLKLSKLMNTTRKRFKADPRLPTPTMEFIVDQFGAAPGQQPGAELSLPTLEKMYSDVEMHGKEVKNATVQELLARELARLVNHLKEKGVTHAAVLIDDLHVYEGCVIPLLSMLGDAGLGQGGAIAPLIFTYVRHDPGGADIAEHMKRKGYPEVSLGAFDDEAPLAHRQFLLTRREQPLALSSGPNTRDQVQKFLTYVSSVTGGVPSRWKSDKFQDLIEYAQGFGVLVDANDEQIVENFGHE